MTSFASTVTPISRTRTYAGTLPDWTLIRDCIEGERRIKAMGETYLPKLSANQKPRHYDAYKDRARFFNAVERTQKGWSGSIFRKEPSITAPDSVLALLGDVDLGGASFEELCVIVTEEVLSVGRAGILVEHQVSAQGRPYLQCFDAEEIIEWRETVVDGARVLSYVCLEYSVDSLDSDGNACEEKERRKLCLIEGAYHQIVYRRDENGEMQEEKPLLILMGGRPMSFIPFVFFGPRDTRPRIQKAPLLDIATTNIHHYKSSADWRQGLHMVALPTPYGLNLSKGDGPLELGPGVFQEFEGGDGAQVGFLEISGNGLELVRQDMEDLKSELAALGAAYVTPPKREAETAEALTLKSSEQNSPLAKIARAIEKGLTQVVRYMARWVGADESAVEVRLNKDFDQTKLSPSDLKALQEALQAGAITPEVYAYQLEQAEVLPPDLTAKDFAEQITAQQEPATVTDSPDQAGL